MDVSDILKVVSEYLGESQAKYVVSTFIVLSSLVYDQLGDLESGNKNLAHAFWYMEIY